MPEILLFFFFLFSNKIARLYEPLQCNIKMNSKISGIQIPNSDKEAPIFQHADDTTLTVSNKKINANEPVFST
jgi:hypothetical protein